MKIKIDTTADALYITLRKGEIVKTENKGDYLIGYDAKSEFLGLETINFFEAILKRRLTNIIILAILALGVFMTTQCENRVPFRTRKISVRKKALVIITSTMFVLLVIAAKEAGITIPVWLMCVTGIFLLCVGVAIGRQLEGYETNSAFRSV
jgi:uncharacterized protein YuzE